MRANLIANFLSSRIHAPFLRQRETLVQRLSPLCSPSPSIQLQRSSRQRLLPETPHAEMAYTTPAEEERMLAFTPSQKPPAPKSQPQNQALPTSVPPQQATVDNSITASTERSVNYIKTVWHECRPWNQFYSTRHISVPKFRALSDRFATNLHLYRANYQVVAAFWLGFVLLAFIPSLLIGAVLFFLLHRWIAWRARKTNNTLQHRDQVTAALLGLTILWITGLALSAFASLALTALSVALHASLHEPNHVETEIATV